MSEETSEGMGPLGKMIVDGMVAYCKFLESGPAYTLKIREDGTRALARSGTEINLDTAMFDLNLSVNRIAELSSHVASFREENAKLRAELAALRADRPIQGPTARDVFACLAELEED